MNKRIHTLANPLVSFFMLLLVAVSYTSCKNEDDPTSSTDQHTVSVQFNGYTEASDTTLKKSSKVEVVSRSVQKISNDMNLVATLEKDASSSTKTGAVTPFPAGTKVRVFATASGSTTVISYADYTTSATSNFVENTDLHVPGDGTYDFYAITYNSTTIVPAFTTLAFTQIPLMDKDFLYSSVTASITTSTPNIVFPTFKQAFARVRVKFDASADGFAFNNIVAEFQKSYKSTDVSTSGALSPNILTPLANSFSEKVLTYPNGLNKADDGTTTKNGYAVSSDFTVLTVPKKSGTVSSSNYNFAIHISTLAAADTTWYGLYSFFNETLDPGTRYTIYLTMSRTGFAGSNIYWDSTLGCLTFDNKGVTTHENYQGVFFKWGSLYGIAGNGSYLDSFSNTTAVYKPGASWTKTTISTGNWDAIPYYTGTTSYDLFTNYFIANSVADNASAGTGDICRYIQSKGNAPTGYNWRMPTRQELLETSTDGITFGASDTYGWHRSAGWASTASTTSDAGISTLTSGATKFNAFFPAAGGRGEDGTLYTAGGSYWSASGTDDNENGYMLLFDDTTLSMNDPISPTTRKQATPIRCVRYKL